MNPEAIRPPAIKAVGPPPGPAGLDEGDALMGDNYEPTEHGSVGGGDQADETVEEWGEAIEAAMNDETMDPVEVHPEPRAKKRRQPPPAGPADDSPVLCVPCDERVPRSLVSSIKPSAEAIKKHNITHLPPRPWCPVCTAAKAREDAHWRGANELDTDDKGAVPTVALDYNEPDEENNLKVRTICGKDETTGSLIHHKVVCKGIGDEWVIRKLIKDFEEFGRKDAMLKTDGEPALVNVQTRIQAQRDGRTLLRNPPVYDPKSNGPCEKAVQDLTAQTRVLRLALEARIKTPVGEGTPAVEWMIEYAAFLLNKFSVGADGMTPWERLTGQKWRRPLVEFGEMVFAKMVIKNKRQGEVKKQKKKFAPRAIPAVWVGQVSRTGEHIVIKPNGDAVKCRTIKRCPEEDRWNADRIASIKGIPRRPSPSQKCPELAEALGARLVDDEAQDAGQIEHRAARHEGHAADPAAPSGVELQQPEPREREVDIREMRITSAILEQFGGPGKFTDGCPGCEYKRAGREYHRSHNAACRLRIYEAMQSTEEGRALLESNHERMARRAAQGGAASAEPAEVPADAREDDDAQMQAQEASPATPRSGHGESASQADAADAMEKPRNEPNQEDDTDEIPDLQDPDDEDDGDAKMHRDGEDDRDDGDDRDKRPREDEADDQPSGKKQRMQAFAEMSETRVLSANGKLMEFDELVDCDNKPISRYADRVKARTLVARTLGGAVELGDDTKHLKHVAPENSEDKLKETLMQLRAVQNHIQVREIIRQLDEGFKAPKIAKRAPVDHHGNSHVAEAYSPVRVTGVAESFGLDPGWALDLTENDPDDGEPYDFSIPEKREKAKKMVNRDKPFCLILSPMCGPFSSLQNFNYSQMETDDVRRKIAEALVHIKFSVELCISQHLAGRLFIFEHPAGASSWVSEALSILGKLEGVLQANFDFCTLDMKVGDRPNAEQKNLPVKKRTKVMTNSVALHSLLVQAQCRGRHAAHADLSNGLASECQVYPDKFCRIICEAIKKELDLVKWRKKICKEYDISETFERLMAIQTKVEKLAQPPEEDYLSTLYEGLEFVDDVTGAPLDKSRAITARKLEMDFFRRMGVYTKIVREKGMKVITTRWLDVNKGDEASPDYRARLVGREIATDKRADLFAATPPLESLRMILSICAMHQTDVDEEENFVVMSNDIKRAYFHAPATRPVYIVIPDEDWEDGDEARVGKLNLSLYGTRDAATNWALKFTQFLEGIGFAKGRASPCNFYHSERQISCTVHGDDFSSTGRERDLQWFERKMKEEFEVKTKFLGPKDYHEKQIRILNRVIEWHQHGLTYEADQRHAEIVAKELQLENAKAVATPGTREDASHGSSMSEIEFKELANTKEDAVPLSKEEITKYRALSARLNYLAQDRPDLQYAVKEVARRMSSPKQGDWILMKRVGRYLVGAPRAVQEFPWQELQDQLHTYVDSDWAGCKTSCRSTNGGVAKIGWHLIKSWSTTQATVAMSSAEAELYAMTKGAANSLGFMAMAADLGVTLNATVHCDASAALGIVQRQGLGRLRHIRVQYLWVQDRLRHGDFRVQKVPGKQNPADLLTKHLPAGEVQAHMESLGFVTSTSRATLAPSLSRFSRHGGEDSWKLEGHCMVRDHQRPRTTLFTPLRVAGAPPAKSLTGTRVTRGVYVDDGQSFERVDTWTARATAHLNMPRRWVGSTTFVMRTNDFEKDLRLFANGDRATGPDVRSWGGLRRWSQI